MKNIHHILGGATALAFVPALAFAQVQLPADHVDLGIGYEAGALELHWHVEDLGLEYAPDEAYAFIPLSSTFTRPGGVAWDFTGALDGETLFVAPGTDQTPTVLFLGLGSEEITNGTFQGDSLIFSLGGVTGPGVFSLWQTNGFGAPAAALSSVSGGPTSFSLTTGGHAHYDWGFTAPGVYELTFTVTGTLVGETTPITDTATYSFAVGTAIPEPSSFAALAGLATLVLASTRRRRAV
jgi:surface-anchored protein